MEERGFRKKEGSGLLAVFGPFLLGAGAVALFWWWRFGSQVPEIDFFKIDLAFGIDFFGKIGLRKHELPPEISQISHWWDIVAAGIWGKLLASHINRERLNKYEKNGISPFLIGGLFLTLVFLANMLFVVFSGHGIGSPINNVVIFIGMGVLLALADFCFTASLAIGFSIAVMGYWAVGCGERFVYGSLYGLLAVLAILILFLPGMILAAFLKETIINPSRERSATKRRAKRRAKEEEVRRTAYIKGLKKIFNFREAIDIEKLATLL